MGAMGVEGHGGRVERGKGGEQAERAEWGGQEPQSRGWPFEAWRHRGPWRQGPWGPWVEWGKGSARSGRSGRACTGAL